MILLAGAFLAFPGPAAPGDLDLTFGTGGKVITDFGPGSNSAYATAIQPDGKILAVGYSGSGFGHFALARYDADGALDATFGPGGKVTTEIGLADQAFAVAVQADGKIVAAGFTGLAGCCEFALTRYHPNGSLDAGFGTGGKVTTSFGGGTAIARAVAVQADGKIVAVGFQESPFIDDLALARYNADGSLDPTFGTGGKLTTDMGGVDRGNGVAIQADGKIVAVGSGGPSADFTLARYNSDGSLDLTFGAGGKVITDWGGFDRANAVGLQTDGKIVAAGVGNEGFGLARYNPDGSLDPTFDGDGKVRTVFSGQNAESALGLAIRADGKIVAAGSAFFNFRRQIAVARYETNGSVDVGFGDLGRVTTEFSDGGDAEARGVAIQTDGKIVAAGGAGPCTPPCQFALVRYLRLPTADLSVTKTDGIVQTVAGQPVTYTITVGNSEPNAVIGATVTDNLPGPVTGATWTCAVTGGGTCTASGAGSINDTLTLLIGSTATYVLTAATDPLATGTLSNTVSVTPPPGVVDLDSSNNSATDSDVLLPPADLAITKTDGQTTAQRGSTITYTIVASNAGPTPAAGATVTDVVPGALTGAVWTCIGAAGGTCTASGTGSISDTVNLPAGGAVTYTLTATVSSSAASPIVNTASVAVPPGVGDPNLANNSAIDTDLVPGADFHTVEPCRVADTRNAPGPSGGPALAANMSRTFPVTGICGIPSSATSVAINVTVVGETDFGDLRLYPAGSAAPGSSTINFATGKVRANNAIIPLGVGGQITVLCDMPPGSLGQTHFLFDVTGYFE